MWVFGYGSLIWKVDFPYEEKIVGYIKGFQRRFYQHSTDHRGVPGKPGRVVTLLPSDNKEERVYGIAYKIKQADIESVVKHLDYREKGGYERTPVVFYPKNVDDSAPFGMVIYLAKHDNPNYAGPADADSIAHQIAKSVGPSGTNVEYVFNLAQAMRAIAPDVNDEHLFLIEKKIISIMQLSQPETFSRTLN